MPWFGVISIQSQSGAGVGGLGHQVVSFGVPEPLVLGESLSTVSLWGWDTRVVRFGVPQSLS